MLLAIDTAQAWSDVKDFVGDHVALSAGIGAVLLFLILALIVESIRGRNYAQRGRVPKMSRSQRRKLRRQRRRQQAEERKARQEERHRLWEAEKHRRKAVRSGEPVAVAQPTVVQSPPPNVPKEPAQDEPAKKEEVSVGAEAPETGSGRRDHLIDVALQRLTQVETMAERAERREQEARRLAKLQEEEKERSKHLEELDSRVREAEAQAKEAEERAKAAEVAAERSAKAVDEAASANDELAASVGAEEDEVRLAAARAAATEEASLSVPSWVSKQLTNLNKATFDQLRELGMSVTQASRVLTQREKRGGFDSVDALDTITGMPRKLLDQIKKRLTV